MEMTISGKSISYDVIGAGSPILFVHGWGGNKESLRKLAKSFEDKHTCYLVDLPGFGESDNPEPDWGVEGYADALRKFILELNISQSVYIGHSFGGALGIYLAANDSDLISKLVLISPSYKRSPSRGAKSYDISLTRRILHPLRRIFYKLFYPGSVALQFAHLESNFRRIIATDLSGILEDISAETLVLWPADDIETPLNDAYLLRNSLENGKLHVVGSVGHNLPIAYPELIVKYIKGLIS